VGIDGRRNWGAGTAEEPGGGILWGQVGEGALDIGLGILGMVYSGSVIGASQGLAIPFFGVAFVESATVFLYGIAEIGTAFQGTDLPPSTDLLIEQATMGMAETGFDK
jgi:hypothetical protein